MYTVVHSMQHRVSRIFYLKQVITEPTRITDTSETAIDLICTSDVENISQSGVLPCKLSDHNVIFCTRKLMKCQFKGHNNVELRIMKCYDKVVFVDKLRSLDWAKVTSVKNVNDSWKIFHEMFLQILDRVAPVKKYQVKTEDGTVVYWGYIKKYKCQRQSMETVQGAKNF